MNFIHKKTEFYFLPITLRYFSSFGAPSLFFFFFFFFAFVFVFSFLCPEVESAVKKCRRTEM